jgi:low temperature requirement protein LtrA
MIGSGTFRLEPPRLRTTEAEEERHATWFELYFDLVFAAAFVELATALSDDPSPQVFARFFGVFVAIAWAWTGFAVYANRFDTDDIIYRLVKSAGALCIAGVAVQIPKLLEGDGGTMAFAGGYALCRFLLVALYVRAWRNIRGEGRTLIDIYIVVFSLTALLWVASLFLPAPYREIVWAVALVIDLCAPPFAWGTLPGSAIVVSHITERFGTFFIVVLGLSVGAVVAAIAGENLSVESSLIGVGCFVIALCVWWIYFDLADTSVVGRGVLGLVYPYAHFLLLPGVAAFGAGTRLAIIEANSPHLEAGARWALAGGLAAFALALALLHLGAEWTSARDRSLIGRLVLLGALLACAAAGGLMSPLAFVLLVLAAMLGQLMLEAFTFPTGAASVLEQAEVPASSAAPVVTESR